MNHTPGPWKYWLTPIHKIWMVHPVEAADFRDTHICDDVNGEANARLIATAPRLLEACEKSLNTLNEIQKDFPRVFEDLTELDEIRSVLEVVMAEARGE